MRIFGAFPINQQAPDKSAQREAMKLLSCGKALVIFPEGGRTRDGRLQAFKPGAFRLALLHGAPIVPVTLSGAFQIWPAHRLLPRPGKLTVTYHAPIGVEPAPENISNAELKRLAADLARRAREVIASALDSSDG
jgi:1-acyl-sn-glycerol-3-phosphate acyltransferase